MGYSKKTKLALKEAPRTLGTQLLLWAVERGFSITQIAVCIGVTRQTVYNWRDGGAVRRAHEEKVKQLVRILHDAENADEAWGQACTVFNLEL